MFSVFLCKTGFVYSSVQVYFETHLEQPRRQPGVDLGPDGELFLEPALLLPLALVKDLLCSLERLLVNDPGPDLQNRFCVQQCTCVL